MTETNEKPLTYYQRNKDRIKKLASLNYRLKKLEKTNENQEVKEVKGNKRIGRKRLSPEQLLANYEARKQKIMLKNKEQNKDKPPKKLGRPSFEMGFK
jgi:hypothetical protein